jgi:3-deoxy-manno-octulosonate cytidylyltransferase (CMP-KDO synthetase)
MKILGIIPSRYESSRFPGKPLIDIAGKSMIQRVYEQSLKSKLINELVVATDDQRIFDHVEGFGGNVMMTSNTHTSGTDRCGEVVEKYSDFDIVINIQGDEPLIRPEQLDELLTAFKNSDVKLATLIKKMTSIEDILNPNRIKVVLDKDKNGVYFSRSPIPFIANTDKEQWLTKACFWKHIGIYAWRSDVLSKIIALPKTELEQQESLEQLRWVYNGYKITTVETEIETPNIDAPEDLKKVLSLLKNM